ncbi:MAG: hypothetical protein ACFFDV_04790 [Candidatus Thorarchaeota archaeon]
MSRIGVTVWSMKLRFGVRETALLGIFTAVHLVITLIPFTISFGGGATISFGLVSAPILGFLLGPFYGVIAVICGSALAIFINPTLAAIGPFTIIATAAGAFGAGAFRTKLRYAVPLLFGINMVLYLISPIGILVPMFIWFHFVTFLLSLLFVIPNVSSKLLEYLKFDLSSKRFGKLVSIWILSIISVTLDQATGSAIGPYYFVWGVGVPAATMAVYFDIAVFIYPIERLLGSLIVTGILLALGETLARTTFGLPLTNVNDSQLVELVEEEP